MQPEVSGSCSDYLADAALKKKKGGKVQQTNGGFVSDVTGRALFHTHMRENVSE